MDKYYLATEVPPPVVSPVLIKDNGTIYSKWTGSGWETKGDPIKYLLGDYEVKEISEQEAKIIMKV
jgi:hypothetical protein